MIYRSLSTNFDLPGIIYCKSSLRCTMMEDMPEYSVQLGHVVKEARAKSGISQGKLAAAIDAANRTVLNIENGRGNPKLAVLYPLVRELNIDARMIFNPEMLNESPWLSRLRTIVEGCTEEEAETLCISMEAILKALRSKDSK